MLEHSHLGRFATRGLNQSVHNASQLPQLQEMGLPQASIQQQGDSLGAWYRDPKASFLSDFIENNNARTLMQKTNSEWVNSTSGFIAPKEYMNQRKPPFQIQSMNQHGISDRRFSGQQVAECLTSLFGNSYSPYPPVAYSTMPSIDCGILRTKSSAGSSFFGNKLFDSFAGSSSDAYGQGVATASMDFDGTCKLSSVGMRQVASEMAPSPEQISSITSCSDVDMYTDTGPYDNRPTFPGSLQQIYGSSSENYNQQKHLNEGELNLTRNRGLLENGQNVCTLEFQSSLGTNSELSIPSLQNLQQDSWRIPEASGVFPTLNTPVSNCQDLFDGRLQMTGSQQFHQQHQQLHVQIDEGSEGQSQYGLSEEHDCDRKIKGYKSSKVPCLLSEQSEDSSIPFGLARPSECVHSSNPVFQTVLLHYMNYKRMHVDGNPISFIKHMHSMVCNDFLCNCNQYFSVVSHFDNCFSKDCNICIPARRFYVAGNTKPPSKCGSRIQKLCHTSSFHSRDFNSTTPDLLCEDKTPPSKRLKIRISTSLESAVSSLAASSNAQPYKPNEFSLLQQWPEASVSNNLDATKVNVGALTPLQDSTSSGSTRDIVTETAQGSNLGIKPISHKELFDYSKEEETVAMHTDEVRNDGTSFQGWNPCSVPHPTEELTVDHEEREVKTNSDQTKPETESELIKPTANSGIIKLKEVKMVGVSPIDCFTVDQMKEHLFSLKRWTGQEMEGNPVTHSVGENTCQLCAMDKFVFAPLPIYCSSCALRIKRNLIYYWALDEMGTRLCFCTFCFKRSHGETIVFHGITIFKGKLQKERNNHEEEESWVQCDKCRGWQHQICGLYNDKRDLGGKAEYVCPICYLKGIEAGDHVPLPKNVAFEAKGLPTCMLSDYIEERLLRYLKQEREERAKALQKNFDEVPGAADLVVRVVLSVDKLLKVNQQFLDIFHDENYPREFPYRSKVILLFQKIEGVDVCLFGMYTQEFGSECGQPNQRCIYISYIDSVKYFRPEIKTASGEALRTSVYHEILVGYLDYCKKRGFATCYIWACPPLKGEDYILYCHPETQKTPKADKLRQWYKSMLRKAAKEKVVVDYTLLYDHFFVPNVEHNVKVTAARLPYFDGDYWSGAAIDMVRNIEQGSQPGSLRKVKKFLTKRTLKAMGHDNLSGNATKDILLMQKLGHSVLNAKEDFIMVHLQFTCTRCHGVILSGGQWVCKECKNFRLCARCHDVEGNLHLGNTRNPSRGERHSLSQVAVNGELVNTVDTDVTIESSFFENRHSFLSFCQGNHYQFDSLRRAKHSSMMILYHLQNSTEASMGTGCCICHQDIVENQGWHCDMCPGFDACNGCYQRKGENIHVHKLSQRASVVSCGPNNGQSQQQKRIQVRQVLEALVHASRCNITKGNPCSYPNCLQIRRLFRHAHQCNLRVAGGCLICHKTWKLLRLHFKICRDADCSVPRCLDLKRHVEVLALQSETRRRAAVVGSLADS
ncbi:histone acetyltransferase HAC12-like [Diospyros lotus]|uniref:histone acetyltransferase HAC12-like n=1 Tax=Diospyros lotus TaxID=55363 RepID=UPI002257ADF6|nr:histone acetyltransferase HAC12-like [Diospyros lotus]